MGITSELKQISVETLDLLKKDPSLIDVFRAGSHLPEYAIWRQKINWNAESVEKAKEKFEKECERFRWADRAEKENLKNQFLMEWEIPELDLDKSWMELTFFLAGYIPGYVSTSAIPELDRFKISNPKISMPQGLLGKLFSPKQSDRNKVFLDFIVIELSEWDALPLVNAVGAGMEIGYDTSYNPMTYLMPHEIEMVINGLIKLSEKGLEERFWRELKKEIPCPVIDWSDPEGLLESMIELYNDTLNYYQDAALNQSAMLLYLT
jgi:Domain of unknown function (DUF1877)